MERLLLAVTCTFALATAYAGMQAYVEPDDAALREGRSIWLDTCENCHGYGTGDAPVPMRPDDWRARVVKDRSLLYQHAIEGFIGPDYSMMPARGGNETLSDEQVRAAVDYMLFLAKHYIEKDSQYINRGEL